MCKSPQDVDRLRETVVVPWRAANIQLKLLCFIYSTVILAYPSSKSLLCPRVTMLHCAINLDAAVSVDASFNDTRCDGGMVCPNDPLLFTCTVTGSVNSLAIVTLPSGDVVQINSDNTTSVVGSLPDGVTVYDHSAVVNSGVADYVLISMIDTASQLNDGVIECSDATLTPLTDEAACPVANGKTTVLLCMFDWLLCKHAILLNSSYCVGMIFPDPPGSPQSLSQDVSANTVSSLVVEWQSPSLTGGSGISITSYTVTIDGSLSGTVSDDGSGVYTHNITGLVYNTDYSVEVAAVNECGLTSQPATLTTNIDARGQDKLLAASLSTLTAPH